MKICLQCGNSYECKVKWSKYCSNACSRKFNTNKRNEKARTDPEYRRKKNQAEVARRHRKRQIDPLERKKHNEEEKARYRKKHNILCDEDLKIAPAGSGCLTTHGYRKIHKKGHPNAWRNGDMFEHVFIMANYLGRPLHKNETVHHKNGIRHDNRLENLELWNKSHPYGQRVQDKIEFYKQFLAFYGYDVIKKI